jgi:1,4-alpha-glucan branching enzyme
MSLDPIHRRWHHNLVTFSAMYMHSENFILPFSHDEVVHGKRSLIDKMPGDAWRKYASLRLLYGYMYGHPGKKLLFMGAEFGQWREWNHDRSLDWHLLDDPAHAAIRRYVQDLNRHHQAEPALYEADYDPAGFQWIDCNDSENSVVSLVRYSRDRRDAVVMVFNFTPVVRADYRIGVPTPGFMRSCSTATRRSMAEATSAMAAASIRRRPRRTASTSRCGSPFRLLDACCSRGADFYIAGLQEVEIAGRKGRSSSSFPCCNPAILQSCNGSCPCVGPAPSRSRSSPLPLSPTSSPTRWRCRCSPI